MHRAHAGAACYRVALPEEAAGIGVSAVRVTVTCDYLTPQGARVAATSGDCRVERCCPQCVAAVEVTDAVCVGCGGGQLPLLHTDPALQ